MSDPLVDTPPPSGTVRRPVWPWMAAAFSAAAVAWMFGASNPVSEAPPLGLVAGGIIVGAVVGAYGAAAGWPAERTWWRVAVTSVVALLFALLLRAAL